MINVTALVRQWMLCSNDLWLRWFSSTENGAIEFPDIELALLNALVLERGALSSKGFSIENFYERLRVIYPLPMDGQVRQVCVVQRSGNVFCKPQRVSVSAGSVFHVKSIDTMGTMGNGRPYVEVKFCDDFLLESPDSVEFEIALD